MAKPWSEVEQSPEYQALDPASQIAAKQEYWNTVVTAKKDYNNMPPQDQLAAKTEFMGAMPSAIGANGTTPQTLRPIGYSKSGLPIYDPIQKARAEAQAKSAIAPEKYSTGQSPNEVAQNMKTVENLLRSTVASWKTMREANGQAGRVAGLKNQVEGITGTNPNVQPYAGQLNETASALAKIANPSGRPGPEMINMFKKGLPNLYSNDKEMAVNVRETMHAAMARYYASIGKSYTKEDRAANNALVDEIIATPSYNGNTMTITPDIQKAFDKTGIKGKITGIRKVQ